MNSVVGIPPSLASIVYEKILKAIINKEFEVDSKLPSEAKLAEKYSVSRPVIRDAMSRLKEDQLIVSIKGSGSFVIHRPEDGILDFIQVASLSDVQLCFEYRAEIESISAGLAAERRTSEQLLAIQESFSRLCANVNRSELGSNKDFDFHYEIVKASNNHYFYKMFKLLEDNINKGMDITRTLTLQQPDRRKPMVQKEHEEILNAIIDQDPERASKAMKDHLINARRRMFEGL